MVKILNCYLYAKKSYGTLSKGAIFFGQPCISVIRVICDVCFYNLEIKSDCPNGRVVDVLAF